MKCIVKNISAGILSVPEMKLGRGEDCYVDFTERIRYYIAAGYIKLVELYADDPHQTTSEHVSKKSKKHKSK